MLKGTSYFFLSLADCSRVRQKQTTLVPGLLRHHCSLGLQRSPLPSFHSPVKPSPPSWLPFLKSHSFFPQPLALVCYSFSLYTALLLECVSSTNTEPGTVVFQSVHKGADEMTVIPKTISWTICAVEGGLQSIADGPPTASTKARQLVC